MSSIFELDAFKPYKSAWDVRQKELSTRGGYYDGSIYKKAKENLWFLGPKANGSVKPLFLPFARAVDVDAGIIPGGWEFPESEAKAEAWSAARDALFDASKWDVNGVLFVHYGAKYGVSGLRVSDDGNVILAPADPTRFMLIYGDMYSSTPTMALWIENRIGADGKQFEYAEVITTANISTFKDGALFKYGDYEAVRENPQKRVPIVECLHINDGTDLGECTYQKAIVLLDEVNDMATRLSGIIKKHDEPQTVIAGAEPTDLQRGSDWAWFLPAGATVDFASSNIDIAGVLEFIREIKTGVHDALPELSFDELKKAGQVATQTIELQLMELVIKIALTRPNYDRALTEAMKIAGEAAARTGNAAIAPLADPELILDKKRPVLPVMPKDAIDLELAQIELANAKRGQGAQEGMAV